MPADPDLIPKILQRWAKGQKVRLQHAFIVGGHNFHGGETWVALSSSTSFRFRLPLNVTGALRASIFVRVSGISVLIGSTSTYAIYHHNGTRSIPRRPVIDLTLQDLARLKKDLKTTLER